jgi:ankyrin repeat protein
MSVFLFWWTLGSSFCSAIAATIATGFLATLALKFKFIPIPITIVIYWILLGIVEWKLLSPYISGADRWGLLTIVGGIIGSCLIGLVSFFLFGFLLKDFSFVGLSVGSNSSNQDLLKALIILIICLFTIGCLLGFGQNLILQNSLSQINQWLIIVTGLAWLIGVIPYIIFSFLVNNPFIYIILVTLLGAIGSLPKGLILGKIFVETGNLPSDALLWREFAKVGVLLIVIGIFSYQFRYPILQFLGFTRIFYNGIMERRIDAEEFFSHGGNPNITYNGNNILHRAISGEDLTLIKLLLSHGADVNKPDDRGDTPLHYSRANNKEIVKLLIDNGANVNAQNDYGTSILHFANHKEIAELLIEKGANVNAQTSRGETPLHKKTLDKEVAQLLLDRGANPNIKNRNELTPLHQVESLEFAEVLIARGADLNARGSMGFTPLHSSISTSRKLEITKLLLKHGADINAKDSFGRTPLHLANTLEVAQLLVDRGAELNAKDNRGQTPLHIIVQDKHSRYIEIAKFFLDRDVNVNAKDTKGKTPLDLAYENNINDSNKDTIELLKLYGGVVSK